MNLIVEENGGTGNLKGNWSCDKDISDNRVKNSISEFTESYEILFDNLKPKKYKYNNGTSGRYHTGFIAQEIVDAIEKAGLTTQDFAGVMLYPNDDKVLCDSDTLWRLRRDEFVSLNTWQIQKLKTRVIELENIVA